MDKHPLVREIIENLGIPVTVLPGRADELVISAGQSDFSRLCCTLHKRLNSPVAMLFACDERGKQAGFALYCVFLHARQREWILVRAALDGDRPVFESFSRQVFSASLFERELREMFGIEALGGPDTRRLRLHDEVWPEGHYPLRKDFIKPAPGVKGSGSYKFLTIEGEGVFEVPVGPVHAGIIGPGHFRFSCAGEPIINLELRMGWTHRGVEKLFEGKTPQEALRLSECVSGDAAVAYSWAFSSAVERICGCEVPEQAQYNRGILLEIERMYNHVSDIGGMALDVAFSFPAQYASLIKEKLLRLNSRLTGSRYAKNFNCLGGVSRGLGMAEREMILTTLKEVEAECRSLEEILFSSVSFMDRVDTTGVLRKKTARDLGILGLAGRASGIETDLRGIFPSIYSRAGFKPMKREEGDCLARLRIRFDEIAESIRMARKFSSEILSGAPAQAGVTLRAGEGLGFTEGWRGPVLFWVRLGEGGVIERCKVVDVSFHNWHGLSFAVLGNIIPDFPVCNKSFDLSYPGNDL